MKQRIVGYSIIIIVVIDGAEFCERMLLRLLQFPYRFVFLIILDVALMGSFNNESYVTAHIIL